MMAITSQQILIWPINRIFFYFNLQKKNPWIVNIYIKWSWIFWGYIKIYEASDRYVYILTTENVHAIMVYLLSMCFEVIKHCIVLSNVNMKCNRLKKLQLKVAEILYMVYFVLRFYIFNWGSRYNFLCLLEKFKYS